jgi:alkylation response protein AidB-like acyl-CoA dehydrogenase
MDFAFNEEEGKLIKEVRNFIKKKATPELIEESHANELIYGGPLAREFFQEFAAKGWLCPNWPKEYGGLESSEMLTYMIRAELMYAGLPTWFTGAFWAGPTILRFGSEEMKKEWLLPIARGEIEFALGYTEPGAGSDLMSLIMRAEDKGMSAEDKGDYYLVNGQKTFNTHAHVADYHWLAVRTGPPKHKGISMLIVDLKSPGISISPMITMAGSRTNEVFYDDVKVPKKNLVGEENKGAYYLMAALDFERMFPYGNYQKLFEQIVAYAKNTIVDGKPFSKNALVRQKLAQMATELEVCKLLYYRLPYILDKGDIPNYQSSMEKLFVTETAQRITKTGMEVLGMYSQLTKQSKGVPLHGLVQYYYLFSRLETIAGGTSEIQRNIIAQKGLGLPRI